MPHVPHTYDQRTRGPREQARPRRKPLWTFQTCLCLRHIGEVTGGLSKSGRNLGPKQTKILGTNLAELTSSPGGGSYQKRWAIESLTWALKSGLGGARPKSVGTRIAVRNPWASRCWPICWGCACVITRLFLANRGVSFSFRLRYGYRS